MDAPGAPAGLPDLAHAERRIARRARGGQAQKDGRRPRHPRSCRLHGRRFRFQPRSEGAGRTPVGGAAWRSCRDAPAWVQGRGCARDRRGASGLGELGRANERGKNLMASLGTLANTVKEHGSMRSYKYAEFLARKRLVDPMTGLSDVGALPSFFKPHQADITRWALKRGRAAIFAGTGLGKTLMELEWARQVVGHTGKPVLSLAPLAVSNQHIREAAKFSIQATIVRSQSDVRDGTSITNYQKLPHFDLSQFGGICLDESSILKSQDGHYRTTLIEQAAQLPFRLAATANPAPNAYMELGNHAEFLGVMSYTD